MKSEEGCLKAGFMLLFFNACLVGACLVFKALAPVLPYLAGGALLVLILAGIARSTPTSAARPETPSPPPRPVPPAFEVAEIRMERVPVVLEAPKCLVCRLALGAEVIYCWRCRTPHHRACFRYAGACAVYACKCRRYRRAG